MKTASLTKPGTEGSVLAVTLVLCGILGVFMGSYLYLVSAQQVSVARSQGWNSALVVAEAGVEESLALLSLIVDGTLEQQPPGSDFGLWTKSGTTWRKDPDHRSSKFGRSFYTVTITNLVSGQNPVIISTGYVPGPLSRGTLARTVRVETEPRPAFRAKGPMIVNTTVNFEGFNVATDSFDSSTNLYSTNGRYDPAKALDNGDVISLSTAPGAVKIGNAKVKGNVRTPPGGTATGSNPTVVMLANGSVGDSGWVDGGQRGIQSGHFSDDVNLEFPDAVIPPAAYWLEPVVANMKIDGLDYKYVLNNSSPWKLADLNDSGKGQAKAGGVYVNATNVVLWVTGSIDINKYEIRIAEGCSLTIYMSGTSASIGGNGVINEDGRAKAFQYFGLPSNTAITFGGNASFVGAIYAPSAHFSLGGGGSNTYDFIGACITRSAKMNGHFNFHYDESLARETMLAGYAAISWDEI
jgi:hypothetical protein